MCTDCGKAMWLAILLYAFYELTAEVLSIIAAQTVGNIADSVFRGNTELGFKALGTIVICIIMIVMVVPLEETMAEVMIFSKSLNYCKKMFAEFQKKTYMSINGSKEGEIQYNLEDDVIDFYLAYTDIVVKLLTLPIAYIYLFSCTYRINFFFGSIVFSMAIFSVWIRILSGKKRMRYLSEKNAYGSQYRATENEFFLQGEQFVFWNIFYSWLRKVKENYRIYHEKTEKNDTIYEIFLTKIIMFSVNAGNMIILLVGAYLTADKQIEPGAVAAMLGYYNVFLVLNGKSVDFVKKLIDFKVCTDRLSFIYKEHETENTNEIQQRIVKLEIRNLSCGYNQIERIHNLSYLFELGDKVLIQGENGSGKSTLIHHLCSLIAPMSGDILINDISLKDISLKSYRDKCALLPQSPFLFQGTVYENLKMGNDALSEEEIYSIASAMQMTQLLDKEVVKNGENLSGGQRQKIGLARALLKKADILFIDEPENNLDMESQNCIKEAISQYPGIVIFVSHNTEIKKVANKTINLSVRV